jgi:hypothetical protein
VSREVLSKCGCVGALMDVNGCGARCG